MGIVEFNNKIILIRSHIITYGNAADATVTALIRDEIETMWNETDAVVQLKSGTFSVAFQITAACQTDITDIDIYQNTDGRNNYFRIEEFAIGNISFVDDLGCNSGYFKLENLYKGSTTAAHEYGHTLGLAHPTKLDIRGQGVPGIMYPRGSIVDAQYQYNPSAIAGDNKNGGTMHPMHRRVKQTDIELLKLHKLDFVGNQAILGAFTNCWHPNHRDINQADA